MNSVIPGEVSENVSNGHFRALVGVGALFGESVPEWDGFHDTETVWTPEQLLILADRVQQIAESVPLLHELAQHGGMTIS